MSNIVLDKELVAVAQAEPSATDFSSQSRPQQETLPTSVRTFRIFQTAALFAAWLVVGTAKLLPRSAQS